MDTDDLFNSLDETPDEHAARSSSTKRDRPHGNDDEEKPEKLSRIADKTKNSGDQSLASLDDGPKPTPNEQLTDLLQDGLDERHLNASAKVDLDELFDSLDQTPDEHATRNPMQNLESQKFGVTRNYADELLASLDDGPQVVPDDQNLNLLQNDIYDERSTNHQSYQQSIQVHLIETQNENCFHEVAVPPNIRYEPLRMMNVEPAKTYPFQLDAFQKEAIQCIENNQSVLVSAHTSAGKTVVALYAIAQSLREKQRVIYTSPIKALSNQKFRELEEEFKDVGLMTGDVTLNPDASCLVMTTEILRSMLYKGSEVAREVGWVVFDEIHYMRDKERGVVWEEAIIMLQHNINCVFLSATIPNARQFAEWIAFLKHKPVHVVYTDYRPTPLMHLIYPAGGEGLYEVVNTKGEFREDRFQAAMACIESTGDKGKPERGKKGGVKAGAESNVNKIVRSLRERDLVPCIVFSFSRKECEAYALALKDMDFNDATEKHAINEIYKNARDLLSDEDKKLPQIGQMLPLLLRGIGVHHSGLLPLIKEIVEILFGEGLLKVLFATETFSMGLNMPARTVVFTSGRKFDGKDFRWLTSGEYIQMSGRAGRRGLDKQGHVIMMIDQQMTTESARQIIKGATDPLNSQFRLTYNMVLNLLRVEGVNPEFMLERSFYQFQNNANIPILLQKFETATRELEGMHVEKESLIGGFFELENSINKLKEECRATVMQAKHIVPYLHAGRLMHIKARGHDFGWGPMINFHRKINPEDKSQMIFVIEVFLCISPESLTYIDNVSMLRPPTPGEKGCWEVLPMTIDCIHNMSAVRVQLPKELKHELEKTTVEKIVRECEKRFCGELPNLDPIRDMKIDDPKLKSNLEKLKTLDSRYDSHELRCRKDFDELCAQWKAKDAKRTEVNNCRKELKKAKDLLQSEELGHRKRVLRRLQYCDQGDIVLDKGRVACEISASDELLLTEMMFAGVFASLTAEEIASLLSCFVFQEKAPVPKMAENLSGCLRQIQEHARRIAKVSNECKIEVDEDLYVDSFKPGLMEVVHEWALGKSFKDVVEKTDVFEGSIIRCLRRLEEATREVTAAAQNMGNLELAEKFALARSLIKRDIVFAASLYL
ncbi:unnamed protein product, partial [Mesorhabditis belari]|uniref:Superkiller viralicidic activity 2-like 2 n=1 Tax=Mesorhabditis belari TaxID=2138241 RepID=A0AAF3FGE7_9BILA